MDVNEEVVVVVGGVITGSHYIIYYISEGV